MKHISVSKENVIVAGSCNACSGKGYVKVFQVRLDSMAFRLCFKCAEILVRELKR